MITVTVRMPEEAFVAVLRYAHANGLGFDEALGRIAMMQSCILADDPVLSIGRRKTGNPYLIRTKALGVLADGEWHSTVEIIHSIGMADDPDAVKAMREAMTTVVRDGTVERDPPAVNGRRFKGDIQYRLRKEVGE